MIHYLKGNLLESNAEALVNTVNTVGVMGKGIALQFKEQFVQNHKAYVKACKEGSLDIGKLLIFKELSIDSEKTIINFPTKREWKHRSTYGYIEQGLITLRTELLKGNIQSIAIPPLGCGNGGLDWQKVRPMIEKYLSDVPIEIFIYEPNEAIKEYLKQKESGKTLKLTDKRAMLLYLMFQYEMSMGEPVNLFVANKLAYFLQRTGEPLRLEFTRAAYGPFSHQLTHVLYQLNGIYIKGLEQLDAKRFEPLVLNYDKFQEIESAINKLLSFEQRQHLSALQHLIRGFESFLALETLATVDFILNEQPHLTQSEVLEAIALWSPRKAEQMKPYYVSVAIERLEKYAQSWHLEKL